MKLTFAAIAATAASCRTKLPSQGRLVTAGGHGGGNVPLDVKYLYLNVITIFGNPIDTPDNFRLALKVAAEGKLKVLIDKVLPLEEVRRAHEIVEGRSGIGKVVLIQ